MVKMKFLDVNSKHIDAYYNCLSIFVSAIKFTLKHLKLERKKKLQNLEKKNVRLSMCLLSQQSLMGEVC